MIGKLLACVLSLMTQAAVEIETVQSYQVIVIGSSLAMGISCCSTCVEEKDIN